MTRPEEAPDEAQTLEIEFERGVPVGLDGERLPLVNLLERVAEAGCRHGVGIVDHIEDRIVGLKVRDIYEVPAAAILLPAHAELERLVGTIHQNQFKTTLDQRWAYLVYAGLWWEPLRSDIDAYMDEANSQVSGKIGMKLFKGSANVVTRESPNAVYDAQLATFSESGGLFSQEASPGLHRAVVVAITDGLAGPQPQMRFWRLLLGRRGAGRRAEIDPPPGQSSPGAAGSSSGAEESEALSALDVSAPSVRAPVIGRETGSRPGAAEVAVGESPPEAAAPQSENPPEDGEPESEISPMRLDEALKRLREENPAPSGETPSDPSD